MGEINSRFLASMERVLWLYGLPDLSLTMRTRGSATSRKHNRHEHYEKQIRQEI